MAAAPPFYIGMSFMCIICIVHVIMLFYDLLNVIIHSVFFDCVSFCVLRIYQIIQFSSFGSIRPDW